MSNKTTATWSRIKVITDKRDKEREESSPAAIKAECDAYDERRRKERLWEESQEQK
jgi:hypothetical protein